jgi:hypothetical protein
VKCDFCGADHLPVTIYRCKGLIFGSEVSAHIAMCVCCDANTDKEWLAAQMDWDEVLEMKPI